jgi:hypothetical protein
MMTPIRRGDRDNILKYHLPVKQSQEKMLDERGGHGGSGCLDWISKFSPAIASFF